ncbi:MAG TPA: nitroreductase family protein [Clostridiales bacterium]|nr:nitroreductase family protein [Clostridiales bacterium]
MNEVINCIKTRRSCRRFKEEQIPDQDLEAILEAGRYAPSGGNNQSCHLIVIQNKSVLLELRNLVEQEFSKMEVYEGMYKSIKASIQASKKGGYDFYYSAPTLVVVANQKDYGNALTDSACLLENMMLAATSLNIGSCWINQLRWLDGNEEIRAFLEKLGLGGDEAVCGGLALGRKAVKDQEPLKRVGNQITYIK